jgi:hypothetical protein
MAISSSPRLGLTRWSADTDQVSRAQFDGDHGRLDDLVAMAIQGVALDRPAAAVPRRLYYATDTGVLSLDTGTAWVEVLTEPRASAAYVAREEAVSGYVGTTESTTSTTYADLATVGPSATATIGPSGRALVVMSARILNDTADSVSLMSFAGAGRTGTDGESVIGHQSTGFSTLSTAMLVAGLTVGTQTFTAKYRVSAGTGTFSFRRLAVIPL